MGEGWFGVDGIFTEIEEFLTETGYADLNFFWNWSGFENWWVIN